jgi:GTP pyrophosphokinase
MLTAVANALELRTVDDLFAAVGYGAVSPQGVVMRLQPKDEVQTPPLPPAAGVPRPADSGTGRIQVMGVGDLLTRLAGCCQPAPGDQITGYITRNHGVTVHRSSCTKVLTEKESERLVQVDWGRTVDQTLYNVGIVVRAWDRDGLLRDVSAAVTEEHVSIAGATVDSHADGNAVIRLTLKIKDINQLSRVFMKLERVRNVYEVRRDGNPRVPLA